MEQLAVESQRGVWLAEHKSVNKRPWVYVTDDDGNTVAWVEYGADTGKSLADAIREAQTFLISPSAFSTVPARRLAVARLVR